jgi:hypothetical protein
VSISFWRPVKNGWQFEQISRCSSGLVDLVFQVAPHAQRASTSKYFGWIPCFTANSLGIPGNLYYTRHVEPRWWPPSPLDVAREL